MKTVYAYAPNYLQKTSWNPLPHNPEIIHMEFMSSADSLRKELLIQECANCKKEKEGAGPLQYSAIRLPCKCWKKDTASWTGDKTCNAGRAKSLLTAPQECSPLWTAPAYFSFKFPILPECPEVSPGCRSSSPLHSVGLRKKPQQRRPRLQKLGECPKVARRWSTNACMEEFWDVYLCCWLLMRFHLPTAHPA